MDSGCVHILNYAYAWSNHAHAYSMMHMHHLAQIWKIILLRIKIFTPHGFILLATRITSTLSWILGKSTLKPKRAHIYTKWCQNPRSKTHGNIISSKPMVQAHGTSFHFWPVIQAHESHLRNFGSCDLEGREVCSIKP